jgi:hypothetical protein
MSLARFDLDFTIFSLRKRAAVAIWNWLVRDWQWPAAALFAGLFLLAILPVVAASGGLALALVYVQLPLYMLHQWEEHRGDRFRQYANRVIGGGREALTPAATFWINCLGVWAVELAAIYLAWTFGPQAGLIAGYLVVVNAVLHVGPALVRREYNPGLATACLVFMPFGGWCVAVAGRNAGPWTHAVAQTMAIGVHLVVVAHVARRLEKMTAQQTSESSPASACWQSKRTVESR